ncbi:MAG: BMP family ABC transporter substrate-binding protein [Solobacterium sp.]|nr:BMP family ABC transporter substrate-binding protein [Solobacterium sp.]MCH4223163.1 BMP family ABC transporter substrate-binding protein [Solobacterium sp.]MCH4266691.1 BMP family ABC transporter substrate-binding protein [Solobacterium sp.]
MKKILHALLGALLSVSMAACSSAGTASTAAAASSTDSATGSSDLKIGVILVGDENEGYSAAHINGIKKAASELGINDDQILWKYSIGETQDCKDAADDLVDQGATLVIANSYGHQTFIQAAAEEHPEVTFVSMTGDTAADSGLSNFKNAFTNIYESRYVSGVVAGMKIQQMIDDGTLTEENMPGSFTADGDIKVGYVGAYPYAEVVSGYTAFFLGVKSVVSNVHMYVEYTNSWFDINKEGETANSLTAQGCVIVSQHADSTGAPSAVEDKFTNAGITAYSVGYNISMLEVAPDVALTSASNDWSVYYNYAFSQALKGEDIATNWAEGYNEGAVEITELGTACAPGTEDKVNEVIAGIKDGSLHVFDTSTFTVDGKQLTDEDGVDLDFDGTADIFPVKDGYFHESDVADGYRSAPYFNLRIDGIEESGATN